MKVLKFNPDKDMKELEKYGYRKDCDGKYIKDYVFADEIVEIWLQEDRSFFINWGYYAMYGEEQERFLDDLIKANLLIVEVDEDE